MGFPGGAVVKNLLANSGDAGSVFRSGRSPGVGNVNSLQCPCLENPIEETGGLQSVGSSRVGRLKRSILLLLTIGV